MEQISIKDINTSTKPILRFLNWFKFSMSDWLFVLSFENKDDRTVHTKYHLPVAEIKNYNIMIDGQKFFDQPVKNKLRMYDNILDISISQGDNYTTGCLLDYNFFNKYYEIIVIDSSKQQALDADPKAIQQTNFTGNLSRQNAKGQNINFHTTLLSII